MKTTAAATWTGAAPARRRPRPGRAFSWSSRIALGAALVACLAATVVLVLPEDRPGEAAARRPNLVARLEALAAAAGLGLDQIEVTGARLANSADILDTVDLANVRSLASLDVAAVKARIERLPWIDVALIERRLPNVLHIRVTERTAFAAWERGDRDVLIDATGRELSTVARNAVPDLTRIAGEHAAEDARRLLGLVSAYPDIAARLVRAERVGGRRWRLHMRDAPRIELPAEADAAALAMLVERRDGGRLLDLAVEVIDLTVLRRITVLPAPLPERRR